MSLTALSGETLKKNTKKEFVSQSLRNIKLTEINGHRFFFGHKIKIIHCMIKKHFKSPVVKRLNIVQQYKLSAEIIQKKKCSSSHAEY